MENKEIRCNSNGCNCTKEERATNNGNCKHSVIVSMEEKSWLKIFSGELRKDIESLVKAVLKSKQEEIKGEMEKMIKKNTYRHTAGCRGFQNQIYLAGDSLVADCTCNPLLEVNYTEYNEVLDDLKPIISNLLK